MKGNIGRVFWAGLAGGAAFNIAMIITFRLIGMGWDGDGILLDPEVQSAKLIAVWTEIEPLPRAVRDPLHISVGTFLFGFLHAFIYGRVSAPWPRGVLPRGLRMSLLLFFMTFLFWEFFTPFNLFGEPVSLVALELVFWGAIALSEGFAIAGVYERFPERRRFESV